MKDRSQRKKSAHSGNGQKEAKPLSQSKNQILTRARMERIMKFHAAVTAGRYPTARKHSIDMEVAETTIETDLAIMRDTFRLPLEYGQKKHGWYYREPVGAFPFTQVSESEAIALTTAQFAIESFPGLDGTGKMRSAIEKLVAPTIDEFRISPEYLRQLITFRPGRSVMRMEEGTLPTVWEGLLNSRELEFLYKKPGEKAPARRTVQPLTLLWVDGCFYLFGHDPVVRDKDKLRTFALPRMSEVKLTTRNFERPLDFDLEKELESSFGIHQGGKVEEVRIRFVGRAVPLVQERIWHLSQKTKELADGALELCLRVAMNPEFERWVLSWGGDARVLEPAPLRERIREHALRMIQP